MINNSSKNVEIVFNEWIMCFWWIVNPENCASDLLLKCFLFWLVVKFVYHFYWNGARLCVIQVSLARQHLASSTDAHMITWSLCCHLTSNKDICSRLDFTGMRRTIIGSISSENFNIIFYLAQLLALSQMTMKASAETK